MYEKEVFVPGLFLRSRFSFLSDFSYFCYYCYQYFYLIYPPFIGDTACSE